MIDMKDQLARGHENIERLLLVLESQLARTLSDEEPDRSLMGAILDYVEEYLEVHHDPVEALVIARLAERVPWMAALCEAHARGRGPLRQKAGRFSGALVCGGPDEVEHAGFSFVVALRRRVVAEDTELLVAASCAFEADDWRSIEHALHTHDEAVMKDAFAELAARADCGCTYR